MSGPLELVLSRVQAHRSGSGFIACCPAHDDRNPSLSISEGHDGGAVIFCHGGCATADVVTAMGLTMADLMPGRSVTGTTTRPQGFGSSDTPLKRFVTDQKAIEELERRNGPSTGRWAYMDAESQLVGWVLRWDPPGRRKFYQPVSRRDDGWVIAHMLAPRPLYRLPDILDAKRVYIVEGEKAAERAWDAGLIATTSIAGAKAAHLTDWSPLAGKECVLVPDNDKAGSDYVQTITQLLVRAGVKP